MLNLFGLKLYTFFHVLGHSPTPKRASNACGCTKTQNHEHYDPEWSHLKEPNPYYPSCTSALTIKYDPAFGRHVVANRDIEVTSF